MVDEKLPQNIQEKLDLLESSNPNKRINAAISLGKSGNPDNRIIEALIKVKGSDTLDYVRDAATAALEELGFMGDFDSIKKVESRTFLDVDLDSIQEEKANKFIKAEEMLNLSISDKFLYQIAEQQAQIIDVLNKQTEILEKQRGNLQTIALVAAFLGIILALGIFL